MSVSERVRAVVEPVVVAHEVELFDLEQAGPVLRVTIDRDGGVDMQAIAAVTRAVSRALDEHDPIAGQYTLEVSSPGLERPLRTATHFAWAIGKKVTVKTVAGHPLGRRFAGSVADADADAVTLSLDEPAGEQITLAYPDIEKARTVFEWGPAPKPGKGAAKGSASRPGPAADRRPDGAPTTEPNPGTEDQAT